MKHLFLLGVIFFLASCGSPELAIPAPTPEAIQISYPAALKPWADKIAICASSNPLIALYFRQSPDPTPSSIFAEEVVLELGDSATRAASMVSFSSWLGTDHCCGEPGQSIVQVIN